MRRPHVLPFSSVAARPLRPLVALVLVATVLGAAGCHSGPDRPGPNDGASLDFTSKATLSITDSGIDPPSLHVQVGDAVTVVNHGTRDRGLTSDSIDTGTLRPGESTVVFFSAAGTVDAYDRADETHRVTIDVGGAST